MNLKSWHFLWGDLSLTKLRATELDSVQLHYKVGSGAKNSYSVKKLMCLKSKALTSVLI